MAKKGLGFGYAGFADGLLLFAVVLVVVMLARFLVWPRVEALLGPPPPMWLIWLAAFAQGFGFGIMFGYYLALDQDGG